MPPGGIFFAKKQIVPIFVKKPKQMAIRRESNFLSKIREQAIPLLDKGDELYLYGSRARGDENLSSDWDIMIITINNKTEDESFEQYIYPLVSFGQKNNQELSVLTYTAKEWEERKTTPFYHNVMKDRKKIL